jgi:hypothetical protein
MAAGDVVVNVVNNPTASSIDTALTAIRASCGANGKYGMEELNSSMVVWGIEEA